MLFQTLAWNLHEQLHDCRMGTTLFRSKLLEQRVGSSPIAKGLRERCHLPTHSDSESRKSVHQKSMLGAERILAVICTNIVLKDISSQNMAVSHRKCLGVYTARGRAARKDPHSRDT